MSTNKFTIELKAEQGNFDEIASSVRKLAASLREVNPELEEIKASFESLKSVAKLSADFAKFARVLERSSGAVSGIDRAASAAATSTERLGVEASGTAAILLSADAAAREFARTAEIATVAIESASVEVNALGNAAQNAGQDLGGINQKMDELVKLNVLETVKSIAGTFNELAGILGQAGSNLRDLAETIEDPFQKNLVSTGATIAETSSTLIAFTGTTINFGAALAQIVSVLPNLGTIMTAVGASFAAARASALAFISTMTVATGGIAAAVIALGYGIERYIAYREQVALTNEAIAEAARQNERNAETLNEYFNQYVRLTRQSQELQRAEERNQETRDQTNEYMARSIALRREELGLYDAEFEARQRIDLLNEARMRYMELESTQLQINSLLMAGKTEEETQAAISYQFMQESASLTADGLREWLLVLPEINAELALSQEQADEIRRSVDTLAETLTNWFQSIGQAEQATEGVENLSRAVRQVNREMEAAKELNDVLFRQQMDALVSQKQEQYRIELEASERLAEIADNARLKQLEGIELQKEAELAALEAIELARAESAERQAELQAAADEKRAEEMQSYLDLASEGYASLTTALVGSIEATATATGKAGAAVSKGIGEGLTALGASAKAAGAVKLFGDPATGFFPNPGAGFALITAGIAAEQIGKAMGGKQRGEQKAAPREVQAPVAPSGPSNNFYANVNMTGMVGNREELARTVVSALSTASRNGVI